MILLTTTSQSLILTTSTNVDVDYEVHYTDITTSGYTPGVSKGTITTATNTTIVAAPAASTTRQIKLINLTNIETGKQSFTLKHDSSGTGKILGSKTFTTQNFESLNYTDDAGFTLHTKVGAQVEPSVYQTPSSPYLRGHKGLTGTLETTGLDVLCFRQDFIEGTFAQGTPGLSGRTVAAGEAGSASQFPIASSNQTYISGASLVRGGVAVSNLNLSAMGADLLWVNTGIVVTTTTAQTINSVAWPARDNNGTTNGDGVWVGLWFTTNSTNAAVTTVTLSYTNSAGTAGRTASLRSINSTTLANTFYLFTLQAGDIGVRSIQSITLGTTLTTGSVSLCAFRPLVMVKEYNDSRDDTGRFLLGPPVYTGTYPIDFKFTTSVSSQDTGISWRTRTP